ncbi:GGDEF domain-containing protein [Frigidibacter mobilis]|uniref:diguanylate cyclase n=1 Tax=Frigidibacter mobilis TaxID=1335048 RepID=A0A159Z2E3_9RHOB|nr:GGDEF domain-containing protein [Frigidibacter mobilis]AMY68210.1 two-component system, PleD-related family,response regulator [Frigidibacter mobilis]
MWLYSAMSGVFPRSFMAKVFIVVSVGALVPLLALLGWAIVGRDVFPGERIEVLGIALAATVLGITTTLLALHEVLKPIYRLDETIRAFEAAGTAPPLPFGFEDQVGRLMASTNRLILSVDDRIDAERRAAETDSLTGLLNRRGFEARVNEGAVGAMLMLDIDGFKAVNDQYGHAVGDTVLRDAAVILASTLRRRDVLARLGGEEFGVFLPGLTIGDAREAAERLRSAVAGQLRAEVEPVTMSVGVAIARPGLSREALIAEANRGLCAAKQGGRNRVCMAVVAQGGMATA